MTETFGVRVNHKTFVAIFAHDKAVIAHIHKDARMAQSAAAAITFYPFALDNFGLNRGQGIGIIRQAHICLFIGLRGCGAAG